MLGVEHVLHSVESMRSVASRPSDSSHGKPPSLGMQHMKAAQRGHPTLLLRCDAAQRQPNAVYCAQQDTHSQSAAQVHRCWPASQHAHPVGQGQRGEEEAVEGAGQDVGPVRGVVGGVEVIRRAGHSRVAPPVGAGRASFSFCVCVCVEVLVGRGVEHACGGCGLRGESSKCRRTSGGRHRAVGAGRTSCIAATHPPTAHPATAHSRPALPPSNPPSSAHSQSPAHL